MMQAKVRLWFSAVAVLGTVCLLVFKSPSFKSYGVFTAGIQERRFSVAGATRDAAAAGMSQLHAQRRQHLHDVCEKNKKYYMDAAYTPRKEASQFVVDDTHNLVYCPIPKIGSSFWKRAFSILGGNNSHLGLFSLSSVSIHLSHLKTFDSFQEKPFLQKYFYLHSSAKFLFVRDPYERLFSGYVDKLLVPNPMTKTLLKNVGRYQDDLQNGEKRQKGCNLNITFEEFIRYVVNTDGVTVNEHFRPANRMCFPCLVDYDFIGKMETFRNDAEFILKSAGVDPSSVFGSASSFEEDSDISIMRDVAARTYAFMNRMPYRSCLSRFQTLQRMWTIFQVRGYLSVNITFPLTRQQAEVTTLTQFQKLLKAAYRDSGDRKVTKLQRHSALVDTFCRLPRPLLKQLQVYLKDDCELFGYECDVDFRFNASVPARSPYFFS